VIRPKLFRPPLFVRPCAQPACSAARQPRSGAARAQLGLRTKESALIGRPLWRPTREVVTRPRCPGLVGLYVFIACSEPAAKPRQGVGVGGALGHACAARPNSDAADDGAATSWEAWRSEVPHAASAAGGCCAAPQKPRRRAASARPTSRDSMASKATNQGQPPEHSRVLARRYEKCEARYDCPIARHLPPVPM